MQHIIRIQRYAAPCGELLLGACDGRLCLCDWLRPGREAVHRRVQRLLGAPFEAGASDVADRAAQQLDEYFAARRKRFDIPLLPAGTEFQQSVWNALQQIPYGATRSYAALSAQIGRQKAVRAVALANGANALSLFIPCHRIIGSDRSLTGYAGGLAAKQFLLELEARQP